MPILPKKAFPAFVLTLLLLAILAYGFLYENYLKPIDCGSYSVNDCPARCAICPECQGCGLACRSIAACKKDNFYDERFEQIRTHQSLPDPAETIRQIYDPALKQYPEYDHLALEECGETMCVKIYLKKDSLDIKKKMPSVIDNMNVVYVVASDPAKQKCGIQNCHGLDITCGPAVPDVCTEIYMLGDNCRKLAKCEVAGGECRAVLSEDFEQCKACVKKCETDFSTDNMKMFECEYSCQQAGR